SSHIRIIDVARNNEIITGSAIYDPDIRNRDLSPENVDDVPLRKSVVFSTNEIVVVMNEAPSCWNSWGPDMQEYQARVALDTPRVVTINFLLR
ncbi:MAG: hypothetical protein AAFO78_11265, partial [Pseudomonadota bacterium]